MKDEYAEPRQLMVAEIAAETIFSSGETGKAALDPGVLDALGRVPRHEFVPVELRPYAYVNSPLPIGCDKTISQPFICALMTDLLQPQPADRVLEIGTGLGYQAAILAGLVHKVYSVEIIEVLAAQAKRRLAPYGNVVLRTGNGYYGWPEHAPFDKIIVTAAPDLIPPMLIQQLKPGGRMAIPAGLPATQKLLLLEKDAAGRAKTREILRVRFSLLEGAADPGA
ncbi:MAG: protein-L-isoaspartate(D-aspartate) O-methyltransferase [Betaproteobacteria bacterium]|nr:protein-L-isoaspartate(D-aspartate) O-methyltransferase [Betaproteobacteria bacterium]MDH4322929.1 protein-L-isoaspartate(D-aspartate) O-methyltransferase [Betaproteobacteria bacterium]